jgi:hypothetical protein
MLALRAEQREAGVALPPAAEPSPHVDVRLPDHTTRPLHASEKHEPLRVSPGAGPR